MDTEYTVWRKRADSIAWELWLAPVARETDAIRVMESEAKASPWVSRTPPDHFGKPAGARPHPPGTYPQETPR